MITRILSSGGGGVNKDLSPLLLPEGDQAGFVWTDANNVRFLDGYVRQFYTFDAVYESPSVVPYFLLPIFVGDTIYWIYAGEETISCVSLDPTLAHTDLSGAVYNGAINAWTGGVLGGIPILNNGVDDPQQWDTDIANNFADLSNWPANTSCKALRVYKQFLVALNITVDSANYPYMVKWSHPAEPGAVPSSWDHTDETVDAGQVDLAEGYGHVVDGLTLRDYFIIYRKKSIWVMNYVGGPYIFTFKQMVGTTGIMNRNCVVEFDGFHFVLTDSDMIVHDGNTARPILDKKVRRDIFRDMDSDANDIAFVVKNPYFNEIWVCYPSVGQTSCDKAVVWNYRDETVSFFDLPGVYHGVYGPVDEGLDDAWNTDSLAWGVDNTAWNRSAYIPGLTRVLFAADDGELYLADAQNAKIDAYVERTGMIFGRAETRTVITGIRPRISGDKGSTLKISVGGSDDSPFDDPAYDATVDFVIGTDIRADVLVERRYIALKIENESDSYQWRLDAFDFEWEEGGEW